MKSKRPIVPDTASAHAYDDGTVTIFLKTFGGKTRARTNLWNPKVIRHIMEECQAALRLQEEKKRGEG